MVTFARNAKSLLAFNEKGHIIGCGLINPDFENAIF